MTSPFTKLFALLLATFGFGSLFAAVPVAVWDGDFSELTKEGFTIVAPDGVTVAADAITIGAEATAGVAITNTETWASSTGIAIAIRYTNFAAGSGDRALGTFKLSGKPDCVGVRKTSAGGSAGIYSDATWANESAGNTKGVAIPEAATAFFSYKDADYTRLFAADGSYLYNGLGLRESGKTVGDRITLGATSTGKMVANGLVITGLAIFKQGLSESDVLTYKFPSEQSEGGTVAKIGATPYETLAAAIDDVAEDGTIEIVGDVIEVEAIELTKNITLTVAEGAKNLLTPITGAGSVTKSGTGTLTVFSLATGLTVAEGMIKAGGANPFGTTTHAVIVSAGGTIDFNGKGNNTAVTYQIAGAGAGDHPYALMNSVAGTGTANLGQITLTANATIGGAGNLSIADPYVGGTFSTKGFTLTKRGTGTVHGGSLTYSDETFGTGIVDICEGGISINQWGCGFNNLKVIVRNGATLTHNNDRACEVRELVVEEGGRVNGASTSRYLKVMGSVENHGTLSGLGVGAGATITVPAGGLQVAGPFVQTGAFTLDLSALTPDGETSEVAAIVAAETSVYAEATIAVTGAEGTWIAEAENGTLKAVKITARATVDGEPYLSIAEAFAAADGKTVNVLYSTGDPIVVDGNVTVTCEDGVVFGGAITGSGSITIPKGEMFTYTGTAAIAPTVKGAGTLVFKDYTGALGVVNGLTDAANWTGTFEFCNITCNNVGNNVPIQSFCNVNSTLRFNGYTQYLVYGTVNAKALEITNTMNLSGSYSSGPEFKFVVDRFTGSGAIINGIGTSSQTAAIKIVASENTYTGSITSTGAYRVTFLAAADQAIGGANGCIYIGEGATATVAEGATWTANAGIRVEGTLVVEGTTAYDGNTPQAATHGTLASKVTGAGEVVYRGALPADAATAMYTNTLWTGSVTIQDFGVLDDRAGNNYNHVRAAFPNKATVESWQNTNSRITFKGVKAWVPNGASYDINLVLEDRVGEDDEVIYAWHNDSGSSTATTTFAKLSGSGTFYDNAACTHIMKFTDASEFTGAFKIQGKRVCLGTSTITPPNGGIRVSSTIAAAGQTWTAPGGVTLEADTTIVYTGAPLALATNTALAATGTIKVALADDITLDKATGLAKVLGWNAKPEDLTVVAEGLPKGWSAKAKDDGLWLRYNAPLVFTIE